MKRSVLVLGFISLWLLGGCSSHISHSTASPEITRKIRTGGIAVLPVLPTVITSEGPDLDTEKIRSRMEIGLVEALEEIYPEADIMPPAQVEARLNRREFAEQYATACEGSRECLMESVGAVLNARNYLFVERIHFGRSRSRCESPGCLLGSKNAVVFEGIIWDGAGNTLIADLEGKAMSQTGMIFSVFPPVLAPYLGKDPEGLVYEACKAAFDPYR